MVQKGRGCGGTCRLCQICSAEPYLPGKGPERLRTQHRKRITLRRPNKENLPLSISRLRDGVTFGGLRAGKKTKKARRRLARNKQTLNLSDRINEMIKAYPNSADQKNRGKEVSQRKRN